MQRKNRIRVERISVDKYPFARIHGIDLKKVTASSDRETLRRLMEIHGVLVFPNQNLLPEDEVRVNQAFGYHDETQSKFGFGFNSYTNITHDGNIPSCPAVQLQGNVMVKDHYGVDGLQLNMLLGLKVEGFHSDAMHAQDEFERRELPVLTSMYCIEAPFKGGETLFACTRTALARIDEEKRSYLRSLRVHYQNEETGRIRGLPIMYKAGCTTVVGVRRFKREHDEKIEREQQQQQFLNLYGEDSAKGGPVHPLIRKHVDTGEEAIFLSCGNVAYMEDKTKKVHLSCEESYDLIEKIVADVCSPPNVYEHRWKKNDFVIWDNRVCMHSGPLLENISGRRLFHRVRLRGSQSANADCAKIWDEVLSSRHQFSKI